MFNIAVKVGGPIVVNEEVNETIAFNITEYAYTLETTTFSTVEMERLLVRA